MTVYCLFIIILGSRLSFLIDSVTDVVFLHLDFYCSRGARGLLFEGGGPINTFSFHDVI